MKTKKLLSLVALASLGLNANAQLASGDYFIQNVESGRFIGGANSWGTQASMLDHSRLFTITPSEGGYTLDSHTFNSATDHFLNVSPLFVDQPAFDWTIEAVAGKSNVYTIKAGDKFAIDNGNLLDLSDATSADQAVAQWRIVSLNDIQAGDDVTFLIKSSSFSRNHFGKPADVWTATGVNNIQGGKQENFCAESYHAKFTISQTITGVPNGKYRLTAQGFYRQDGNDNENLPYIFINDAKGNFPLKTTSENSMADASTSFSNGDYKIDAVEVIVSDGTITLGAKCEQGNLWCIWDNFGLTYLGKVTDLSAFKDGFDNAVAAATGVDQSANMNASVLAALKSALTENSTDFSTYSDADVLSAAITALSNAAKNATASIENYAAVAAKLNTLDANGKAAFLRTDVGQLYAAKTYVDEDCTSAFATAAKAQTTAGADMTLAIINAGIYNPNNYKELPTGWDADSKHEGSTSKNWTKATGDTYMENWNSSASGASFNFKQTITGLPKGTYTVTADMFASTNGENGASFVAGDYVVYGLSGTSEAQAGVNVDGDVFNTYTTGEVTVVNGTLVIGVKNITTPSARWFAADNFKLTFVSAKVEYPAITKATGKMNASVASAQDAAVAAFEADENDDTYAAAVEAIVAAEASVEAYKKIAAINEKVEGLSSDVQAQYASTLAAYNAGTLTTADEAEAAFWDACYKAVTSKGTDMTSAIVNPSFEENGFDGWTCANGSDTGSKDNSNGTYTMAGCDGAKLFNTWNGGTCASVTQTITGLKAGKYAVVATMATDADHELYVSVNNGTRGTVTSVGKGEGVVVSAEGEIALGSNELTIEAGSDGIWYKADNFKLVLLEEYAAPVIADLTVNDGVAVAESQDAKNITYVREFKAANKWQSLFLPFSVNLENNTADVVLAKIDDVMEDNGELVIKIIKVSKYETVDARRPLFIAAKTVGVKNIKTGVSTIGEPRDGGYEYSAAEFMGVLSSAQSGYAGKYVMSGGELCLVPQSMNNLTLGVNRWAMSVNGGADAKIRINAEGFSADEATAIANAVAESVENGEIFSINGAKVKDAKSGLYIKGGKKVYVK